MKFSEMLHEAMEGRSQAEVARASGVSQPVICRLLGGTDPSFDTSIALEKALPRLRELRLKATA